MWPDKPIAVGPDTAVDIAFDTVADILVDIAASADTAFAWDTWKPKKQILLVNSTI